MKLRFDNNKGFTLIEILVVMGLTILVMALIFGPLVQSLTITRSAEIIIKAQDNARFALAQVSRDLSNAMYIYDSAESYVYFPLLDGSGRPLINELNPAITPRVYFSKVDLILPRMRGYCPVDSSHTPGGMPRGEEMAPTCQFVLPSGEICGAQLELRPMQPLTQDTKIVRYFVGLEDPTKPYSNGYSTALSEAGGDNTYVLFRAEFYPMDPSLFPRFNDDGTPRTLADNLSDPDFFYRVVAGTGTVDYAQNWRSISVPIVTLEDIDLISIEYDSTNNPIVTPMVKFAPTAIYNDPLVPTTSGDDNPDLEGAPAATYKATYGNWVLPYKVTLEPEGGNGTFTYETMPGLSLGVLDPSTEMCIYYLDHTSSPPSYIFVFNITHYMESKAANAYAVGDMFPISVSSRTRAFTVNANRGIVNFAFPNTTETLCTTFNNNLGTQGIPLSAVLDSSVINSDPSAKFLLNCPYPDGTDPRVLPGATVVPGSVRVKAPDAAQISGTVYTPPLVAYVRSPYLMRDPDTNQFSVDLAYNADYINNALPGVAALYFNKPKTVNPTTAGNLPGGSNNVLIYYEVQNNKRGDVLRANYVTKSVMTVQMGIRIYDSGTKRAQVVQFTNKVRVKNIAP